MQQWLGHRSRMRRELSKVGGTKGHGATMAWTQVEDGRELSKLLNVGN